MNAKEEIEFMEQCKSIEYLTNSEIDWHPPEKDIYTFYKDFLTYPVIVSKNSGLMLMVKSIPENWSIEKDLKGDKLRLEEVDKNISRLCNLLSSEFISKAPKNIIEENCNKLMDNQNEWDVLNKKISIIEKAKIFVDYIDSLATP